MTIKAAMLAVAVFPPMCLMKMNSVAATRISRMAAARGARFPSLNPVV